MADNTSVVITLDFFPRSQRWVLSATRDTFSIKGVTLCIHPNLLRSYRRVIPFGIACISKDNVHPFDINDFQNARIKLYILDNTDVETEVSDVETAYYQSDL